MFGILGAAGRDAEACLLDVVSRDVNDCPDEHRVGDLSMEPLRLIEWDELDLWTYISQEGSAHGKEDERCIEAQVQSCSSGQPD